MPAFAPFGSPSSLNFNRSTKSAYSFVVQRNSLRGTLACKVPPTIASLSIRKDLRSPSQPLKDLPSKSLTGFERPAATSENPQMTNKSNQRYFFIGFSPS